MSMTSVKRARHSARRCLHCTSICQLCVRVNFAGRGTCLLLEGLVERSGVELLRETCARRRVRRGHAEVNLPAPKVSQYIYVYIYTCICIYIAERVRNIERERDLCQCQHPCCLRRERAHPPRLCLRSGVDKGHAHSTRCVHPPPPIRGSTRHAPGELSIQTCGTESAGRFLVK